MKFKRSGTFANFFIKEFKKRQRQRQQQRHKGSNVLVKRRKFLRTFSSHTSQLSVTYFFCNVSFFSSCIYDLVLFRTACLEMSLRENCFKTFS